MLSQRPLNTPARLSSMACTLSRASSLTSSCLAIGGKFWLCREPHPEHLVKSTRESPEERQALLDALEEYG